jgi:hypothetical protein
MASTTVIKAVQTGVIAVLFAMAALAIVLGIANANINKDLHAAKAKAAACEKQSDAYLNALKGTLGEFKEFVDDPYGDTIDLDAVNDYVNQAQALNCGTGVHTSTGS